MRCISRATLRPNSQTGGQVIGIEYELDGHTIHMLLDRDSMLGDGWALPQSIRHGRESMAVHEALCVPGGGVHMPYVGEDSSWSVRLYTFG